MLKAEGLKLKAKTPTNSSTFSNRTLNLNAHGRTQNALWKKSICLLHEVTGNKHQSKGKQRINAECRHIMQNVQP